MTDTEILVQEYNNLWHEKLIHTEAIRKFHNYFTNIVGLASVALLFYGISAEGVFGDQLSPNARTSPDANIVSAVNLICVVLPPMMLLTRFCTHKWIPVGAQA